MPIRPKSTMKSAVAKRKGAPKKSQIKKAVFDSLNEFGDMIKTEAAIGKEMAGIGIETEFSKLIDSAIDDPKSLFKENININVNILYKILEQETVSFLKSKKSIVSSIHKTYEGLSLHYCIVLKKDNIKSRAKFYEYVSKQIHTGYCDIFPIVFQFIPKEMESDITSYEKIA